MEGADLYQQFLSHLGWRAAVTLTSGRTDLVLVSAVNRRSVEVEKRGELKRIQYADIEHADFKKRSKVPPGQAVMRSRKSRGWLISLAFLIAVLVGTAFLSRTVREVLANTMQQGVAKSSALSDSQQTP